MLTVRWEQMDALDEKQKADFVRWSAAVLREKFSEKNTPLSDSDLHEEINRALTKAAALNIPVARDGWRFLALCSRTDWRFWERPQFSHVISRLLDERVTSASRRLDHAMESCTRQELLENRNRQMRTLFAMVAIPPEVPPMSPPPETQPERSGPVVPVCTCHRQITRRLEVLVIDKYDEPVLDVPVVLMRGGTALTDRTGADGIAYFSGLTGDEVTATLSFLDRNVWRVLRSEPLVAPTGPEPEAEWAACEQPDLSARKHPVQLGESLSSVAFLYGLMPETVASEAGNAALLARRGTLDILHTGDVLHVPGKELRFERLNTGFRHIVQRMDVPSSLTLRFLDVAGLPRAREECLIEIETERDEPLPVRMMKTNDAGIMRIGLPPSAIKVILTAKWSGAIEHYDVFVGQLGPIETVWGLQTRLRNLGYYSGPINDTLDESTIASMQAFQAANGLTKTHEPDAATRSRLRTCHTS